MKRSAIAFVEFAVLLVAAVNAHALCMSPDGSLDDVSVPGESIALNVLPACNDQAAEIVGVSQAVAETARQQKPAPAQTAEVTKIGGKRVWPADNRQTANGESRLDYIDEAELMMLWLEADFEAVLSR